MQLKIIWRSKDEPPSAAREVVLHGSGPFTIGRAQNCNLVLPDLAASRLHARLEVTGDDVRLVDEESANGTFVAGRRITSEIWPTGTSAQIGEHLLEVVRLDGDERRTQISPAPDDSAFPPATFQGKAVPAQELRGSGLVAAEVDYTTLGAGLGSFVWVDHLRIFGVPESRIRAIGIDSVPYGKYARLCANSQIPGHERLRSNSISTPDNIWGFPGYASRESLRDLRAGKANWWHHVMQVFGEPTLAESYTPRADDVFQSLDREAARIGWSEMFEGGRILKVRMTDDGRYAIAYRVPSELSRGGPRNRIVLSKHLHIAMGYPASRYLDDLQEFKRAHPLSNRVTNAYEQHDEIYDALEREGGIVLVRGRGIVASRILQRLYEARRLNSGIRVLHVMRSRIQEGKVYDLARRHAAHDIEYQPFNWPKSCWGGTLRQRLEQAVPEERVQLLGTWGGTTTADRSDWDALLNEGKQEGWYRPFFGDVADMDLDSNDVKTRLRSSEGFGETVNLSADYVIDCTGLIADLDANPVLADLIATYNIRRNAISGRGPEQRLSGLFVSNSFEVEGLRNGSGTAHAAGVMTLNGPYAAVDSFLGLQYAALRSVDNLSALGAPGIKRVGPIHSVSQWLKWCQNARP
ncbi:MAG: FHA domain-containing protein [Pseudomonadota bacterium]